MNVGELADAVTAITAEVAHDFHGLPLHNLNFLIRAVGDVEKALLLVARESHTKARTESRRSLPFDEDLFDEFSIQLERLNAIIHAIADIDDAVVGNRDPMNRVELLRSRALVDARFRSRVIRLIAVSPQCRL